MEVMYMQLLNEILISKSDEEAHKLISERIRNLNLNSYKIEQLSFVNNSNNIYVFKGFIPLDTRIKYLNLSIETYSMNTTDFFYEFAGFIRKHNIDNKGSLIYSLEFFINQYFKSSKSVNRTTFNNLIAKLPQLMTNILRH